MANTHHILIENGGWCWFQDPRVMVDRETGMVICTTVANKSGVEGQERNADIDVTTTDPIAGTSTTVTLGNIPTGGLGDDHNVAAIWQRPDGRYLAMYTGHNYGAGYHGNDHSPQSFYRISVQAHDATAWKEEQVFQWPSNDPVGLGQNAVTYSNLLYLANEGGNKGRLYNIARSAGQVWQIATSEDWGEHWTWRGYLSLPPAGGRAYSNGYVKFASNGRDRIDFIITEAHPRDYNNGIYHGFIRDGKTHRTDGSVVDSNTLSANGFPPESFTPIFLPQEIAANARHTAWSVELSWTYNNELIALFLTRYGTQVGPLHKSRDMGSEAARYQCFTGTADHRLYCARLHNDEWSHSELGKMGAGLLDSEEDYTGLGVIDRRNGNRVYLSTPIDPRNDRRLSHHEIFRGEEKSGTWTWEPITSGSTKDNLRPLIAHLPNGQDLLLWMAGTYEHQTDYATEIRSMILP